MDKIIFISEKNEKYLKKIINICENGIVKNQNAINCFTLLKHVLNDYQIKEVGKTFSS